MLKQYCDRCGKPFDVHDIMVRGVEKMPRFSVYFMDHIHAGFQEAEVCWPCFRDSRRSVIPNNPLPDDIGGD